MNFRKEQFFSSSARSTADLTFEKKLLNKLNEIEQLCKEYKHYAWPHMNINMGIARIYTNHSGWCTQYYVQGGESTLGELDVHISCAIYDGMYKGPRNSEYTY